MLIKLITPNTAPSNVKIIPTIERMELRNNYNHSFILSSGYFKFLSVFGFINKINLLNGTIIKYFFANSRAPIIDIIIE